LFDDLLLDSRRKGKTRNQKREFKRKKERGLCVCTKFSTVLGCWEDFFVSRLDPCSKEFHTQLKMSSKHGYPFATILISVPSEFRIWELGFALGLCEELFLVESGRN
jgi:hypothetical protein